MKSKRLVSFILIFLLAFNFISNFNTNKVKAYDGTSTTFQQNTTILEAIMLAFLSSRVTLDTRNTINVITRDFAGKLTASDIKDNLDGTVSAASTFFDKMKTYLLNLKGSPVVNFSTPLQYTDSLSYSSSIMEYFELKYDGPGYKTYVDSSITIHQFRASDGADMGMVLWGSNTNYFPVPGVYEISVKNVNGWKTFFVNNIQTGRSTEESILRFGTTAVTPETVNPTYTFNSYDFTKSVSNVVDGSTYTEGQKIKVPAIPAGGLGSMVGKNITDFPSDTFTKDTTGTGSTTGEYSGTLQGILDSIKSIPQAIGNFFTSLWEWLQKIIDAIKSIPGAITAWFTVDWTQVQPHMDYAPVFQTHFKPFYDIVGLLKNIQSNPQSHDGKFYMKIPHEMGGDDQEHCVLDLSVGAIYITTARTVIGFGIWISFLWFVIKQFSPKLHIS